MIKLNQKITTIITITAIFLTYFSSPLPSLAAPSTQAFSGRCVDPNNLDVPTIQGLECLFYNILQVIVAIAGLVFLFMFISGGYSYLFSSGDEKKVAQASSILSNAVVGLVGIIISWLILRFIQNFTGLNVTDFLIPG